MKNIHPTDSLLIDRKLRENKNSHKGVVFWLYGLSGSGKSTLAIGAEKQLFKENKLVKVLDGDNIRSGLNSDLSFTSDDRKENIRRIAEVAKLFSNTGIICIVSFITPKKEFRELAKKIIGEEDFKEIYIKASFDTCRKRDVKGLYKLADAGKIDNFTGKNTNTFEEPNFKENKTYENKLIINTEKQDFSESMTKLMNFINKKIN